MLWLCCGSCAKSRIVLKAIFDVEPGAYVGWGVFRSCLNVRVIIILANVLVLASLFSNFEILLDYWISMLLQFSTTSDIERIKSISR